jgi:NADPH-dependent glutamate synthase beta subunit-like oxidoreductase
LIDQPIAIRALKRFALEWADKNGHQTLGNNVPLKNSTGFKVAIIGAGPAGLTAGHDLVKMGHSVTVFEAGTEIGGKIRSAIPESKYPHDLLDKEIEYIKNLGAQIEINKALGRDFTLKNLQDMGFDSILLAIGSKPESVNKELNISDDGCIIVDEKTGLTSMDGVFSAGDAIHAKNRSLIQAVADGKRSAYFIDLYLRKQPLTPLPELKPVSKRSVLVRSIEEPEAPRVEITKIDGMERTLTEEEAIKEASRCLACGCGVGCGRCYQVCIYSGVDLVGERYVINDQNCDGCWLCVEICPNEAIEMIPIEV